MMRDGGDPVLRSLGEAVIILALGLGEVEPQSQGGFARQKQVRT